MSKEKSHKRTNFPVLGFRVSEEMKEELDEIIKAKNWPTAGEFYRSVMRQVIRQYKNGKE